MSAAFTGLLFDHCHWVMGRVSFEPPAKVSSLGELTGSLMKVPAGARLVLPLVKVPLPGLADGEPASAKIWSQSCEVVVEPDVPRTPVVALPSSSNVLRRLGRT